MIARAMPMPTPAFAPVESPLLEFVVAVEEVVAVEAPVGLVAGAAFEGAVEVPALSCTCSWSAEVYIETGIGGVDCID